MLLWAWGLQPLRDSGRELSSTGRRGRWRTRSIRRSACQSGSRGAMEQRFVQTIPVLVLAAILCLGLLYTLARMRRTPASVMPVERPAFKSLFGWGTLLFGVLQAVRYAADTSDPTRLALAIAGVVLGAVVLLSPSYSEMSEAERRDADRGAIIATGVVVVYIAASFLLHALAPEQITLGFQFAFVCGVIVWAMWRFLRGRRA